MTRVLEQHNEALSLEFKSAITPLEQKLDFVQATVTDHRHHLILLEENANQLSDQMGMLQAKCEAIEESYAKLKAKTIDLDSCCRCNNIRIVGLPESIEGVQPTTFFSKLLVDIIDEGTLHSPPELDRAHRALTAKPAPGSRPRAVIARVHYYRTKEAIIQEARRRRCELSYQGKPVEIFEDYCPEVIEQRTAYRKVMSKLYQGLKPTKDGSNDAPHSPAGERW